eukprot:c27390_g3_i1 orf=459-1721(-)
MRGWSGTRMAESTSKIEIEDAIASTAASTRPVSSASMVEKVQESKSPWLTRWQRALRWIPTSTEAIIASEQRLLSLVKTPYVQEQVSIGSGPPGSNVSWFRSSSDKLRFINTITFDNNLKGSPTLVMMHGYAASQGFFFRNFDELAAHFRVIAIDQLGWGASSRPDFTCKSTEEAEAWFVDSFEEWRKANNLENFILLGHSLGGYIAAKYALKYPEHLQHLILVGPAGFTQEKSDWMLKLMSTWRGIVLNRLWESNFTPQKVIRTLGPWGPDLVRKYTGVRFGTQSVGNVLNEEESKLLSDYAYHTLAAKPSGELCLKYIFSFGAYARSPLLKSSPEWKVRTSFIYGTDDWMDYKGGVEACRKMDVPGEVIRVPQAGHFVFLDNAKGFHSAVLYSCQEYLSSQGNMQHLFDDFIKVFKSP